MWADTKNPKFFPDLGCRTVGWQQKNQNCLSDLGCRSVGGQQKNQSLKEGVICYGRRTFLLNLSYYQIVFKGNDYMDKKQAINIINKCAKTYKKYLDGYQIVFIYRDENNKSNYAEVQFRSHNFLHFTGVTPRQGLLANDFYRFALNSKLSENDFSFKHNHTTELKLSVLNSIMNIDTSARMIGNYIGPHLELYTEKVTGTTTACLGLVQANNCYVPNSVLSEDIRSIVPKPPGKIYAIFKKRIGCSLYTQLTYKSNNLSLTKKCIPKELISQIDSSLLATD
jgi:hypothetical protein